MIRRRRSAVDIVLLQHRTVLRRLDEVTMVQASVTVRGGTLYSQLQALKSLPGATSEIGAAVAQVLGMDLRVIAEDRDLAQMFDQVLIDEELSIALRAPALDVMLDCDFRGMRVGQMRSFLAEVLTAQRMAQAWHQMRDVREVDV